MTREDALEILNRKVVVEVVIVIDGRLIQGIRGRNSIGRISGGRESAEIVGSAARQKLGENQQHEGNQSRSRPGEGEEHAFLSLADSSFVSRLVWP